MLRKAVGGQKFSIRMMQNVRKIDICEWPLKTIFCFEREEFFTIIKSFSR